MYRKQRNTKLHIFAIILTLFDLSIYAFNYLVKSLFFPTNTGENVNFYSDYQQYRKVKVYAALI